MGVRCPGPWTCGVWPVKDKNIEIDIDRTHRQRVASAHAMPLPESEPISEVLRGLIDSQAKPLKEVALHAGVDYQRLYRWYNRITGTLDADLAEAVYKQLTGKAFVRP